MAKCLFPVTILKVLKTNINVRVQESSSTCQAFLFIICAGSKSLGYDCPDLRRFIISLNLSHERRRASVHGFTPYCILLHSLSFVWVVFVETYFIMDPKRSVTFPNGSASKKWKAITMTMKLDIVKHCEKRKIATNTGQLLVLSHLTFA